MIKKVYKYFTRERKALQPQERRLLHLEDSTRRPSASGAAGRPPRRRAPAEAGVRGADEVHRRRLRAAGAAAYGSSSSSSSAISRASASDEVAAGEGALRTWSAGSVRETTKSSTSEPSRATAWARIPAGPATKSVGAQLGDEAARRGDEGALRLAAWRSSRSAGAPVARHQPPGAGPGERVAQVGAAHPREPVGVAGADDQRRGAEQDLAVDRPGQVGAEERQVGVGDRVDAGPHEVARARAAAAGSRRGRGRSAARPGRPAATASRSDQAPAQTTTAPARGRARAVARRYAASPAARSARATPQPVSTEPPAPAHVVGVGARRPRRSRRPRSRASGARRSRARAARSRAISSASTRRRPGTPFARPRRSSSSSRAELGLASVATISLPVARAGIPRSSQ